MRSLTDEFIVERNSTDSFYDSNVPVDKEYFENRHERRKRLKLDKLKKKIHIGRSGGKSTVRWL